MKTLATFIIGLVASTSALGQASSPQDVTSQGSATAPSGESFDAAAKTVRQQLEESMAELAALRERVAAEMIPLSKRLSELETQLVQARADLQQANRVLGQRAVDLSPLRDDTAKRREQVSYLSNLLGEYIRNLESGLHITELQRYRDGIDDAKLAADNATLSSKQVFEVQAALLEQSLDRLFDAAGGARFEGTAVDPTGVVKEGTFVKLGPAAIFRSSDGLSVGTAEQRLGSLEPSVIPFESPEDREAASTLVTASAGSFPLDPTLGNAHKVESTQESLIEHIRKGGPVMVPIFALAGAALLVVLVKWLSMMFVRKPSQRRVKSVLAAVARRDKEGAAREANAMGGPTGRMLATGVEHLGEPRELIEEVMYETVLATRLRLNRWLPFVAICASSAPLLGLLGTVTGIMNTFSLITVFGTGDVKTLSSGISEALITTEYGLIVAIPSLLLHAFLSRKARGIVDQMEKSAIAFANQVSKTPFASPERPEPRRDAHERQPETALV